MVLLALLAAASACGDDGGGTPTDAAGDWTLAITNGDNGCDFDQWQVGQTASSIPFTITQSGADVTGNVGGLAGTTLDVVLGSHTFTGDVAGHNALMTLYGERSATSGNCTWTVNATIDADVDGDVMVGTIDYTIATNGNPDCASREGCHTVQQFNGTRPPST